MVNQLGKSTYGRDLKVDQWLLCSAPVGVCWLMITWSVILL